MVPPARLPGVFALAALALAAQPSQFIRLEIAAADSSGHPVTVLRASELRISDDGALQSIAFFHRNGEQSSWQSTPLAPGEYSNRSAVHPITVVVMDLADSSGISSALPLSWEQTVRALQRYQSSADLYLYLLTPPTAVLEPLRALPASQAEAAASSHTFSAASLPPFASLLNIRRQPLPYKETGAFDSRVAARYAALESLASQMALLPGRKTLVWIGPAPRIVTRYGNVSLPPGQAEAADAARRLVSLLDQADIAVYTVATTAFHQAEGIVVDAGSMPGHPVPQPSVAIADVTGGQSYRDQIEKAIGDAVSATQAGYRVFYPAPLESREPYRKIKVTCTRRGVRLTTRQAYYFETVAGAGDTVARERTDTTVAALRDAPDIGLRVALSHPAQDPRVLHVVTRIDASDLLLFPDAGAFRGNLSLEFIGYTGDGRKITLAEPMRIGLRLAPADRDAALKNGLSFPEDLSLDTTIKKLRVIATDERAAIAGSVTIPLEAANASPPAAPTVGAVSPSVASLHHVSEFVRTAIAQLPRYTCSATVDRTYFRQTRAVGRSCDEIIAAHKLGRDNLKATATDRLRFDVEVADGGYEIFSWPGASRIDSEKIENFSGGGPIGTGPFGPFLIDIFANSATRFDDLGEETIDGRTMFAYRFRVPVTASHYKIGVTPTAAGAAPVLHIVPYEGRFWIDRATNKLARLEVSTTALPPETQTCEGDTVVDLQTLKIGEGDYLIPRQSVMRVTGRYGQDSESTTVYSACHEFRGEAVVRFDDSPSASPAAGAAPATPAQHLPPGLPVPLSFETQIDTATSAAGDPLVATVARNVIDPVSKKTLIPAGARLTGRILRLEHHLEGRDYFIVSIAFDSPHLMLDHPRQILSPAKATPCWGSVDRIESKGTLTGGSTFILPSRNGRYTAPRGCESSWITVP